MLFIYYENALKSQENICPYITYTDHQNGMQSVYCKISFGLHRKKTLQPMFPQTFLCN